MLTNRSMFSPTAMKGVSPIYYGPIDNPYSLRKFYTSRSPLKNRTKKINIAKKKALAKTKSATRKTVKKSATRNTVKKSATNKTVKKSATRKTVNKSVTRKTVKKSATRKTVGKSINKRIGNRRIGAYKWPGSFLDNTKAKVVPCYYYSKKSIKQVCKARGIKITYIDRRDKKRRTKTKSQLCRDLQKTGVPFSKSKKYTVPKWFKRGRISNISKSLYKVHNVNVSTTKAKSVTKKKKSKPSTIKKKKNLLSQIKKSINKKIKKRK